MRESRFPAAFIRTISLCTARNPEVVASTSPAEQARVAVEAITLLALTVLVFTQWFSLIGAGGNTLKAALGALVFTVLYIGYDYLLGASLERQTALGDRNALAWMGVALRVAISAVGAIVLSTAWTLDKFGPEIDTRNRMEAATVNAPVRAEYAERLAEVKQRLMVPIDEQIRANQAEQEQILARLAQQSERHQQQQAAADDALREVQRQNLGVLGAIPGQGPLHRFAMAQREAAQEAAARASAQVAADEARIATLRAGLRPLEAARAQALRELTAEEARLEKAMLADPRWVVMEDRNFLTRFRGLIRLMNGEDGIAVALTMLLIGLLFVSLECAYLGSHLFAAGMTYGQRDLLRERRDFEFWAQSVYAEIRENQSAYRKRSEEIRPAETGEATPARSQGIRVVELRTGALAQEGN